MNGSQKPPQIKQIQTAANEALETARNFAPGSKRIEALKKAGKLRLMADNAGVTFAKRGRPAK